MPSGETTRQNQPTNKSSKKNHTHCSSILLEIGSMSAWCIEGVKFINSELREVDMKYAPQMVGIFISQYPQAPHILSVNRSDACSDRSQRGQCAYMPGVHRQVASAGRNQGFALQGV